jgi:hypothetical protein
VIDVQYQLTNCTSLGMRVGLVVLQNYEPMRKAAQMLNKGIVTPATTSVSRRSPARTAIILQTAKIIDLLSDASAIRCNDAC